MLHARLRICRVVPLTFFKKFDDTAASLFAHVGFFFFLNLAPLWELGTPEMDDGGFYCTLQEVRDVCLHLKCAHR